MGVFLQYAWAIPLFPLLACALITFTPVRRSGLASGWLATGTMAVAALFALGLLAAVATQAGGTQALLASLVPLRAEGGFAFPEALAMGRFAWVATGDTSFAMGYYVDPIVAVMLAMVTLVGTCIHLFSIGYLASNARQGRFFSFVALFTAAMLAMTLADNLLLFFMAWEVMGLCSYLLIGFIYVRPQAHRAALKAFITTRVGDVLLLIGLAYLYTQAGSLAFGTAPQQIFNPELLARLGSETNALGLSHATAIALLIFCGTVGKSAQFPLHVWLPDAMEGPTPVSALIHAATMVAAGVFLVGRTYPIFLADDGTALAVVAFVGALTALFGALVAVAQFDIKRVLAYSTISQLGLMVAALGIGGWTAGMFHLLTHAFFKALLFLGSGAVIHAMEATPAIERIHHQDEYAAQQTAQDLRNMGGLRERLPWTFWSYTLGFLALAGLFPLAGFWSKDEVLADAFVNGHWVVYLVLSVASLLTAFYMARQWTLTFLGTFRGDTPIVFVNPEPVATPPHASHADSGAHSPTPDKSVGAHWHEDPRMIAPLVVLASFAVAAGFFNLPLEMPGGHWLSGLLGQPAATLNWLVAGVALLFTLLGIGAGYMLYRNAFAKSSDTDPLAQRAAGLFGALANRLYVDQFYAATIAPLTNWLALAWQWIDRSVIDRVVNGVAGLTLFVGQLNFILDDTVLNDGADGVANGTVATGERTRRVQTGKIEDYTTLLFGGTLLLAVLFLVWLRRS